MTRFLNTSVRAHSVSPSTRRTIRAAVVLTLVTAASSFGASGTWTGAGGDGLWSNPTNWTALPGQANGSFNSPDIATFDTGSPTATVAVDTNRNVAGVTFHSNTDTFTIGAAGVNGGPALYLSNGGTTQIPSDINPATGQSLTFNAPVILAGNAYTFRHDSVATTASLVFRGNVTAGSAGATVLTLDGAHLNGAGSNAEIRGVISNGASGTLGITKTGTGWWEIIASGANPNTYSGDTVINQGTLRIVGDAVEGNDGLGGLSPNSNYIVNTGGTLRVSLAGNTARSVTVNTGGIFNVSTSSSHIVNLKNENGFGLTLNYATQVGDTAVSLPISLTGTTANQGGVKLISNPSMGQIGIGATTSPFDLGTVIRPFDIGKGAATNLTYDLRIRGPVGGGGVNGGIVKTGAGILRFDNAVNSWTGTLDIREGEVRVNVSNGLNNKPFLSINGGTFNTLGGQTHTWSGVTITKGTLLGSNNTSTTLSPFYAVSVGAGDTATISTALGDAVVGTPATLTKTGAGLAILTNPLNYTGQTIVNGGTLQVNENAQPNIIGSDTVVPNTVADVRSGRLVFDYTGNVSKAGKVVPLLQAGFATNFTTGPIRSSTASGARGLGYRDDTVAQQFIVAAALYGDFDLNGTVNFDDLVPLAQNYGGNGKIWSQGDATYDGVVNFDDLVKLAQNYGASALLSGDVTVNAAIAAGFETDWALAQSLAPEPTALSALTLAASALVRRQR